MLPHHARLLQAKASKIVMCANMLHSKSFSSTVAEQDTIVKTITDLATDIHCLCDSQLTDGGVA